MDAATRPAASLVLPATLAAWLIYVAADFWTHAVILAPYWKRNAEYWRPMEELFQLIPVGYASFLVYCFALAWLLARLYPDSLTIKRGLRFGALAGLVTGAFVWLGVYSVFRMPASAIAYWTVCTGAESSLAGGVAAWVFGARKPWRHVAAALGLSLLLLILAVVAQNLFVPDVQLRP